MNTIITIGRQYGSGGRELGTIIAKKLGIDFVDEELVTMAAEKNNVHKDILKAVDEKATKSFLYALVTGSDFHFVHSPMQYEMPLNDKLFITQSEIIKNLASEKSCVIVGRCADYVLRECKENCINIFAYTDMESKIKRIMRIHDLTYEKAKERIQKVEKSRKAYYNYYTNNDWGKASNYDICVNTGLLGLEKTADLICDVVKLSQEGK